MSGVLRTTLTYAVPTARSGGTGDTRMAATSVPSTRATAAAASVSFTVAVKPST